MTNIVSISQQLQVQFDDLVEQYDDAKLDSNGPLMDRLNKSIGTLAKQVKEHQIHEHETLKRDALRRMAVELGQWHGASVRKFVKDNLLADMITEDFCHQIGQIIEDKERF